MRKALSFLAITLLALPMMAFAAPAWNTSGSWVLAFDYLGTPYPHDMTLVQDVDGNLTGNGGNPAGGAHVYTWVITSGSVNDSTIDFYADYTASADAVVPQTTMHVTGTIAADGTMSGTWTDNYQGGVRGGTWTSTSGVASEMYLPVITGGGNIYDAKGKKVWTFGSDVGFMAASASETGHFTLQRHIGGKLTCHFTDISNVEINGNIGEYDASGMCGGALQSVHVTITDNGEPGAGVDTIALSGYVTLNEILDGGNFQVGENPFPQMTFTAANSAYYNGPDNSYPMYGDGAVSFTWDPLTGNVTGGYYNEVVPATTGTTYYNMVTGGTVVGTTVNLTFNRTNPNAYGPFYFVGTLVGGVLSGQLDGPYLFTATGTVTP